MVALSEVRNPDSLPFAPPQGHSQASKPEDDVDLLRSRLVFLSRLLVLLFFAIGYNNIP